MKEQIINGTMTILAQAILSILGLVVTAAICVAVTFIVKKKEEVVAKIGADKYNATYAIAKAVFYEVEQQFKGVSGVGTDKAKYFDNFLLKRVPGLKEEDLRHFREAVVGEFNARVKDTKLLDPATTSSSTTTSTDATVTAEQVASTIANSGDNLNNSQ